MAKDYRDSDLESYQNQDGGDTTYAPEPTAPAAPTPSSTGNRPPGPPPPPSKPRNPHLDGLYKTFYAMIERAKTAKYARTAANYQGLAGVVAQMAGQEMANDRNEAQVNSATRGQTIDYEQGQDKTQLGLAELSRNLLQDKETSAYHQSTLENMANKLGIDTAQLGFEKEKFGTEVELKNRALDIEQNKVDALSEKGGLTAMQKELGALTKQRTGAMAKIYATQGVPKQETSFLRQAARKIPGLASFVDETAPNKAMKSVNALDTMYQGAMNETLQRYGVIGDTDTTKPYWQSLLEE